MSEGQIHDKVADLPPLRALIHEMGLSATKALGQNFLLDLNLTAAIARLNGALDGLDVVEVGPGPGGLTRALLLAGARSVHAVEFDSRAIAVLQSLVEASDGRLNLHQGDALHTDLLGLGAEGARTVIANLPYNVATPIVFNLLQGIHARGDAAVKFMLLMFQKEVAQRICAVPDSKTYGRLAVMAQWLCEVKIAKIIPPSAFTPAPKVHSAIVRFVPRKLSDQPNFASMEKLVAQAFSQRRKMLRAVLHEHMWALEVAGIDVTLRPEHVAVQDYVRLAKILEAGPCA